MPISNLANLLLAAGVPKISPSTLPSLDFTFRPSVLAGAGAAFEPEAAGAGAVFEPLEAAGGGESVFLLDAQPNKNARHAAETSSLLSMCKLLCNSSSVIVIVEQENRSEEHTSELQSLRHLVCRLLLEKKKKKNK